MKKFILLIIVGLVGCNPPCTVFAPSLDLRGKWLLIKKVSPSLTQTTFQSNENLSISLEMGVQFSRNQEITSIDKKSITTYNWEQTTENCQERTVIVIYTNGLQRKFWFPAGTIQATGYVKQIGGADDTLRYFYERVQ